MGRCCPPSVVQHLGAPASLIWLLSRGEIWRPLACCVPRWVSLTCFLGRRCHCRDDTAIDGTDCAAVDATVAVAVAQDAVVTVANAAATAYLVAIRTSMVDGGASAAQVCVNAALPSGRVSLERNPLHRPHPTFTACRTASADIPWSATGCLLVDKRVNKHLCSTL